MARPARSSIPAGAGRGGRRAPGAGGPVIRGAWLPPRALPSAVLSLLLLASVNLSVGEETEGVPFFNDQGQLTLPRESVAELEEAIPETRLFRGSAASAPDLADLLSDP
ncbi:MAG: hypothetical protein ACK587_14415 [Cyanobacteriota bacterium]